MPRGLRYPRPEFDASTHEFCTKCRQVKPHADFPPGGKQRTAKRSGLHPWCRVCNNKATYDSTHSSDLARRKRLDQMALSARRRAIETGARPPGYWDGKPLLYQKPNMAKQRLIMLGLPVPPALKDLTDG